MAVEAEAVTTVVVVAMYDPVLYFLAQVAHPLFPGIVVVMLFPKHRRVVRSFTLDELIIIVAMFLLTQL